MRPGKLTQPRAALAAPGLLVLAILATVCRSEDPGRLGRLFRFGGPSPVSSSAPQPLADEVTRPPLSSTPTAPQPRLIPQPRVSRAVTDADPIVTRVSLGRSDDGHSFGMFLQVYADGTVIDSEGVHRPGREAIKEVVRALEQGDLYRIKGHCGAPSTDFVEQVQVVVYDRSLGRLRANSFSFSGNPQGCDASVRRLQTSLDGLQTRLSGSGSAPDFARECSRPDTVRPHHSAQRGYRTADAVNLTCRGWTTAPIRQAPCRWKPVVQGDIMGL